MEGFAVTCRSPGPLNPSYSSRPVRVWRHLSLLMTVDVIHGRSPSMGPVKRTGRGRRHAVFDLMDVGDQTVIPHCMTSGNALSR